VPSRDSAPLGAPCWVDLFTSDPDKTRPFYIELFGWTVDDPGPEYGGYVNFLKEGIPIAGSMRNDQAAVPDVWSVYLATDNAEATVSAATSNGGQVVVPAMAVMELGSMAVVTDPGHATIGIWQPGLHKGFGLLGEPGAPAWFELHTRHYEGAIDFYRTVFKWDTSVVSDTAEFRYTTLGEGDSQLAGIMDASQFLPEGVPAHWSVYFGVTDTDETLDRVAGLGGSIVTGAEDTPYGRLATAADPTGAVFKLVALT
jgi:predicted enzyme related to lactoylglutathione lyase